MGKPRRPRGTRPTWEPKPAPEVGVSEPVEAAPAVVSEAVSAAGLPAAEPSDAAEVRAAAQTESPPTTFVSAEPDLVDPVAEAPESASARAEPVPSILAADEAVDEMTEETAEALEAAAGQPVEQARTAATPRPPVAGAILASAAANRIVFAPDRLDVVEIGSTIARYVRGEGEAALAHFRALTDARTPADLIRLQVGEVQRAADASLSCWVTVVSKASRVVAFR
jgi:hypothetical protein